ncbi:MAG: class I SAM-dependent rRNA methyltransferase, partial [Myxococcota bacterium]|nr:class I SAM-dependent rRNA methyltransferase [Myxococcota bacterium]
PGDGLPGIVVDRYNDLAVLRLYGKCWEPWLKDICVSLLELHEFKSVFRRFGVRRVDGSSGGRLLAGEPFQETLIVTENGLKFV